jgi:hypothetical protein
MATLEDFETLDHCRLLNIGGLGWSAPVLQADFGGGYGASVVANQDYGLHRWNIRSDFLPDKSEYEVGDDDEPYFTYYFEFFKRHILRGNKPFIVHDNRRDKYYLVRFPEGQIDFNRITAKFYSHEGIQVTEARYSDLTFNGDGSLAGIDGGDIYQGAVAYSDIYDGSVSNTDVYEFGEI